MAELEKEKKITEHTAKPKHAKHGKEEKLNVVEHLKTRLGKKSTEDGKPQD